MSKIYAIRTGDFVEFRASKSKPRRLVSKLSKVVEKVGYQVVYDNPAFPYGYTMPRTFKTKLVVKQVFYEGGLVLGVCKYGRFRGLIGALKPDGVAVVSRESKDMVLEGTHL